MRDEQMPAERITALSSADGWRQVLYVAEAPYFELVRLAAWAAVERPALDGGTESVIEPVFSVEDMEPMTARAFTWLIDQALDLGAFYLGYGPTVHVDDITPEARAEWTEQGQRAPTIAALRRRQRRGRVA